MVVTDLVATHIVHIAIALMISSPEHELLAEVISLLGHRRLTQLTEIPGAGSFVALVRLGVAVAEIEALGKVTTVAEIVVAVAALYTVVDLKIFVPLAITVVLVEPPCLAPLATEDHKATIDS